MLLLEKTLILVIIFQTKTIHLTFAFIHLLFQDEYGARDYRKKLQLKLDHAARPLWVVSTVPLKHNIIILSYSQLQVINM